ncbi:hypothetical protein [Actibacterium sp. 188UL27-1]|uniref:hypothetical protein n=1 Tax=Actibacterium sp. 188UL27-1 TaxID=2786961 RepID=UPI00195A8270|nr:hypothetical protein [Actibacterium sp. 188UL27-1]MBM7067752.1 hypothetical protein [Actibacterium sp. 188UL27-1]
MENYDTLVGQAIILYGIGVVTSIILCGAVAALFWRTGHGIWWCVGAVLPVLLVMGQPLFTALMAPSIPLERINLVMALPMTLYSLIVAGLLLILVIKPWPNAS